MGKNLHSGVPGCKFPTTQLQFYESQAVFESKYGHKRALGATPQEVFDVVVRPPQSSLSVLARLYPDPMAEVDDGLGLV